MPQLTSLHYRGDIALIKLDNPPVNALGQALRAAVLAALDEALASPAKAVILYGGGRGFSGGADISEFSGTLPEPDFQVLIERCETAPKPVIAAIHGIALGGGLELALGCAYRVAAPDALVGLPEVKIGVLPGAGGTQRLPRLIGVREAAAWITSGDPVPAKIAAASGVIDEIIEGDLLEGAIVFAQGIAGKPVTHIRARRENIAHIEPGLFETLRAETAKRSRNLMAPLKIIDAIEAACTLDFDAGLQRERELFEDCRASPQSKALVHIFFSERGVWKIPGLPSSTPVRPVAKVAIIGAGTMGGGIAMAFANAGIEVDLIEAEQAALDRGVARIRDHYAASVAKGRLGSEAAEKRLGLLRPGVEIARVAEADLIIEAVFERMDVKLEIFRQIDHFAKPGAILATNTSMLDVNQIAAETKRPQDVVGLHFFSPANVMRLLEIVRGEKTSPEVLAAALAVARKIGKIPAVVGVCDGFVGNRMVEQYFREAEFLVAEGASPLAVDRALTDFGLAMGPFAMSDMAGIDIRWDVAKRRAAQRRPGERYSALVEQLGKAGRFGQKTNAGFYRYGAGSRTALPDPALDEMFITEAARQGIQRREISPDEIVQRCLYALVNEGAYILEEGIAARASDIDVIYVNGYGFPAYRGGPMFWAESIGLAKILADIEQLRQTHGEHWRPSALLTAQANKGLGFTVPGAK